MKNQIFILLIVSIVISCTSKNELSSINEVNWKKRMAKSLPADSMVNGKTYLAIYSHIYSQHEHKSHNLTATVSIRNTNISDTIYIDKAEYFGTKGEFIRSYFDKTIYLAPMETIEIIIDEVDKEGGSGANFLFDWQTKSDSNEPLFDGVMISTSGQQGISFTTQGKRIK